MKNNTYISCIISALEDVNFTQLFQHDGTTKGKKQAVRNIQDEVCRVLRRDLSKFNWKTEAILSNKHNDRADILGSSADMQIIVELDATRADQVAKKTLSRLCLTKDKTIIYIPLLYPGTDKMVVMECKKYIEYGRDILEKINPDSALVGVILEKVNNILKPDFV